MNTLSNVMEVLILAMFSVMFVVYAIFVYPFEKLSVITNTEAKQNQIKYAPQI